MTADLALLAALRALQAALDELEAPAMIIGGIAVIARGVPRQTIDIDVTVRAADLEPQRILDVLARHSIRPRIADALDFLRRSQVFLLRHEPTGTPIELSLAWLPFEEEALRRATALTFEGIEVKVAGPEDLIIYKTVAWRDRDRSDIERLLVLHGDRIDLDRVRDLLRQIVGVLEDPRRITEFEVIVQRALGERHD